MPASTATDADPRAPSVEARLRHLEERTSRLTGALWLLLDAHFAVVNRLGALAGDTAGFKRGLRDTLLELDRAGEPQLSPVARATYAELLARLDPAPPAPPPTAAPHG